MTHPRLSKFDLAIMDALWTRGASSVPPPAQNVTLYQEGEVVPEVMTTSAGSVFHQPKAAGNRIRSSIQVRGISKRQRQFVKRVSAVWLGFHLPLGCFAIGCNGSFFFYVAVVVDEGRAVPDPTSCRHNVIFNQFV